jgi:hypothetical protein
VDLFFVLGFIMVAVAGGNIGPMDLALCHKDLSTESAGFASSTRRDGSTQRCEFVDPGADLAVAIIPANP